MIRKLLTTTALAAALVAGAMTTGALAQDQRLNEDTGMTPAPAAPGTDAPAMNEPSMDAPSMDAPATGTDAAAMPARDRDILSEFGATSAEELIGSTVYSNQDEDLGEVADVVVSGTGQVDAIVIDVGGFLGIGAKPVALEVTSVDIRRDEDGDPRLYTSYTQETLEALPEYSADATDGIRDVAPAQ